MNKDFELVVTIVSKGQSDKVVQATRTAGARGGTILLGRGTSPTDYESILGVHILPEKEIVLTIVDSSSKQKMMKLICDEVALNQNGNGLCFSLPINNIVGSKKISATGKMAMHSSLQTSNKKDDSPTKPRNLAEKISTQTSTAKSPAKQKKQVRAKKID